MSDNLRVYQLVGYILIASAFPAVNIDNGLLPYPVALFISGVIIIQINRLLQQVYTITKLKQEASLDE